MNIYIDLDDCLIKSTFMHPGRGVGRNSKIIRLDGEKYASRLREDAISILKRCRAIAPTRLFTSAMREYAYAHNNIFELGFAKEEIISREDYMYKIMMAYGGSDYVTIKQRVDPSGILIDNNPHKNQHASLKREYLGIPKVNYYMIREFRGMKDPDKFQVELEAMFSWIADCKTRLQ